jgi:DNA-binding Lrp family transcriptional regulator
VPALRLNDVPSRSCSILDKVIDALDQRLLEALTATPRAGVLTLARQLGVARGTVQARLDKLVERGVITGFGPDIDLDALGYTVHAFVTLEIAQGRLDDVVDHLRDIPEVIEVHMVTGVGDLLCRLAARTNEHLGAVLAHVLEVPGISRTTTVLSLSLPVPRRVLPVVAKAAQATVRATAT